MDIVGFEKIPELLEISRRNEILIKTLLSQLDSLLKLPATLGVKQVSELQGVSPAHARSHPYYLPNFGKSDFPDGVTRWNKQTVEKWVLRSIDDRKQSYQFYLESIRAECAKNARKTLTEMGIAGGENGDKKHKRDSA